MMAATNLLEGLDPALIREGRFDLKIRVDLPDEDGRLKILESLLRKWSAGFQPAADAAKMAALPGLHFMLSGCPSADGHERLL